MTKDGIPHIRATAKILSHMVAVRIHLDPVDEQNGPLRVLPGTHIVDDAAIDLLPENKDSAITCFAAIGDVLFTRPLLLHSSPKPVGNARRRVLQLEVTGPNPLPDGFEWHAG